MIGMAYVKPTNIDPLDHVSTKSNIVMGLDRGDWKRSSRLGSSFAGPSFYKRIKSLICIIMLATFATGMMQIFIDQMFLKNISWVHLVRWPTAHHKETDFCYNRVTQEHHLLHALMIMD